MSADLVLRGGTLVDVVAGGLRPADVAIAGEHVAAVGEGLPRGAREIDCAGRFIAPGLIDGHIHIESSHLAPWEFARAVAPHGTTTVVADAHEVANVCGIDGVRFMVDAARDGPLDVFLAAPSCVPATHLETSGAELGAAAVAEMLDWPETVALGEMMNVPGVLTGDPDVLAKLRAAHDRGLRVDGHAPGLGGDGLRRYVAAGPSSDHECTTPAEAREKLEAGMWIMIREGTAARDLDALLPMALDAESASRCLFVSDDIAPHELLEGGHLDRVLRRAVRGGLDAARAIVMVTLNPARRFGLDDRGVVEPGKIADVVVFEDLLEFAVSRTLKRGRDVAEFQPQGLGSAALTGTCRVGELGGNALRVPASDSPVRVIGTSPGRITTDGLSLRLPTADGELVADPSRDVAKIAVVERHGRNGGVGVGFVRGLGIRAGAIASTVAHDSHNIIVAGVDDGLMSVAVEALVEEGGGFAYVSPGGQAAICPLPIAGLMSECPLGDVVASYDAMLAGARSLGSTHPDPFAALSFLALPVIPELKITDRGLVDVSRFEHVPLVGG